MKTFGSLYDVSLTDDLTESSSMLKINKQTNNETKLSTMRFLAKRGGGGYIALEMNIIALEMNNYNANCNQQTKSNFFQNLVSKKTPITTSTPKKTSLFAPLKNFYKLVGFSEFNVSKSRYEAFKLTKELNIYIICFISLVSSHSPEKL